MLWLRTRFRRELRWSWSAVRNSQRDSNYSRQGYRIVIVLREDYLADFEGIKKAHAGDYAEPDAIGSSDPAAGSGGHTRAGVPRSAATDPPGGGPEHRRFRHGSAGA